MNEARKILDEAWNRADNTVSTARAVHETAITTRGLIDKARAALESVPEREELAEATKQWRAYRDAAAAFVDHHTPRNRHYPCDGCRELIAAIAAADPLADRPKGCSCYKPRMALGGPHDMGCPSYPKLAEDVKAFAAQHDQYARDSGSADGARFHRMLAAMARRVFAAELGENPHA